MNVNKKLDRFKQWAGERMGGEAKTNVSDDFKALEAEMNLRHDGTDRLHKSMTAYVKAISKRSEGDDKERSLPIAHLGSSMVDHGEDFDVTSEFGQCLTLAGRTHERLARMQESYAVQATSSWLEALERSLAQMKEYQAARKKLENRRLAYDAALAKMQKAKKEDFRVEEELRTQKAKYEETSEDVYRRMQDIQEAEGDNMHDLTSFIDAELNYHERCREILLQLRSDWPAGHSQSQTPNGRRPSRARSNTAHSFQDRYETVEEEPVSVSPARRPTIKSTKPSSSNIFDDGNRERSDPALQRPVYNRVPTFEGPTQLRKDESASPFQAPSRIHTDLSIRSTRSGLRPVSKIYDTYDNSQDDSGSYGNVSPYDERSASPATSQGSYFSRTPSSTTINTANIGKKGPPPPPPSRAKKPPPPPPPAKRSLIGAYEA